MIGLPWFIGSGEAILYLWSLIVNRGFFVCVCGHRVDACFPAGMESWAGKAAVSFEARGLGGQVCSLELN